MGEKKVFFSDSRNIFSFLSFFVKVNVISLDCKVSSVFKGNTYSLFDDILKLTHLVEEITDHLSGQIVTSCSSNIIK